MPGTSQIAVASGVIQSLTVSNESAQHLSIAHAFVLTPALLQATGSNSQSNAAPITTPAVVVVQASASSRGIRLPVAGTGLTELITNAAAHGIHVFPASGNRIGAGATNASTTLAAGKGGIFFAQDAKTWRVILGA